MEQHRGWILGAVADQTILFSWSLNIACMPLFSVQTSLSYTCRTQAMGKWWLSFFSACDFVFHCSLSPSLVIHHVNKHSPPTGLLKAKVRNTHIPAHTCVLLGFDRLNNGKPFQRICTHTHMASKHLSAGQLVFAAWVCRCIFFKFSSHSLFSICGL